MTGIYSVGDAHGRYIGVVQKREHEGPGSAFFVYKPGVANVRLNWRSGIAYADADTAKIVDTPFNYPLYDAARIAEALAVKVNAEKGKRKAP